MRGGGDQDSCLAPESVVFIDCLRLTLSRDHQGPKNQDPDATQHQEDSSEANCAHQCAGGREEEQGVTLGRATLSTGPEFPGLVTGLTTQTTGLSVDVKTGKNKGI